MKSELALNILELDQKLNSLRIHFESCKDASNQEVLDWAKFFLGWSKTAAQNYGDWSRENRGQAENLVKQLEKKKTMVLGYEVLERMMAEAALNLDRETAQARQKAMPTPGRAGVGKLAF